MRIGAGAGPMRGREHRPPAPVQGIDRRRVVVGGEIAWRVAAGAVLAVNAGGVVLAVHGVGQVRSVVLGSDDLAIGYGRTRRVIGRNCGINYAPGQSDGISSPVQRIARWPHVIKGGMAAQ